MQQMLLKVKDPAAINGVFDPRGSRHTIESKLFIVMNVHASMPTWLVARGNKAIEL